MSEQTESTKLGVRSLFQVVNQPDFTTLVGQQLYSWCKRKRWDADRISGPGVYEVARGVTASLIRDDRRDRSTIERYRFHQDEGHGTWITHLTTYTDRNGDGWVWTDVFEPAGRGAARVPRLAQNILEVVDGLDGHHPLTAQPVRAGADDVDQIYDALLDDDRRGFLFLAGADDKIAIPRSQWAGYVEKLLTGTTGLAGAYVLDSAATGELNARLPETHRINPWTIRTFLPSPDLTNPQDSIRHRVLSTHRIIHDGESRLRNRLAHAACRHSATIALPNELVRIDRALRGLLDETIVDQITDPAPVTSQPEPVEAPDMSNETPAAAEPETAADTAVERGPRERVWNALAAVLSSVTDRTAVTVDSVMHLGRLASEAQTLRSSAGVIGTLRERLNSVQAERNALEDQNSELTERIREGQNEIACTRIDLADTQARVRQLSRELAKVQNTETEWAPAPDPIDTPPLSFQDLVDRIGEFTNVEFTGDEKPALDLDDHDSADWAIATWGYLRVLDEYCDQRASGRFEGSIGDYISTRPKGYASIPPGSHASNETRQLQDNTDLRRKRQFPVPESVNPNRYEFMGEHIKIAAYKSVSPRMHILNRAAKNGRIYIGYIGRHLDNFHTN
ncbi:MAG: hypothetical protein QM809_14680 [Gordonia sp. (in: high G+C Gram-positive bacteria)]|uniref:hypothetical protein n=1 Tax=Gordonia sp. (in: high G+C Gram-positive bacteria) TaxID=84139 RepID=UPI0039E36687